MEFLSTEKMSVPIVTLNSFQGLFLIKSVPLEQRRVFSFLKIVIAFVLKGLRFWNEFRMTVEKLGC